MDPHHANQYLHVPWTRFSPGPGCVTLENLSNTRLAVSTNQFASYRLNFRVLQLPGIIGSSLSHKLICSQINKGSAHVLYMPVDGRWVVLEEIRHSTKLCRKRPPAFTSTYGASSIN